MLESKIVTVSIDRDWHDVYEAFWRPEAFPTWASGLSEAGLEQDGGLWTAWGPEGPIRIRFSPHNPFGVMDHWVDVGKGRVIYVPLRIIENGNGADVMLTLFRQLDMDDAHFAEDERWVRRDLEALKVLAEA